MSHTRGSESSAHEKSYPQKTPDRLIQNYFSLTKQDAGSNFPALSIRCRQETGESHEKNLSAQRHQAQTCTRFPCSHGHQRRSQGTQRPPRQGPRPPERLSPQPSRLGLPRTHRLRTAGEFRELIRAGRRSQDTFFIVHARPNHLQHARLGVTVSRRVSPRAVLRNRLKRLIRETFRQDQTMLAGFDIVVVARPAARDAERAMLCASLQRHWKTAR